MTSAKKPDRLQTQLANIIALESTIEQTLLELIPEVSAHAETTALLSGFQDLARDQRQALETRLQSIADTTPISKNSSPWALALKVFIFLFQTI